MTKFKVLTDRLNTFFTNNKITTGDSIPTSGEWVKGDICISTIQENGECGWICTESGTPGKWEIFGSGGSGKLVSLSSSVEVNGPVTEVSLDGLGTNVSENDKLFVHYNSTHLLEGVDFEIISNGTKIRKLGGGSWNESSSNAMFAFELLKHVKKVNGDNILLDSKMCVLKSNKTILAPASEVEIGIEGFNKDTDFLTVYVNSTYLTEGVDYDISSDSTKIVSRTGNWNEESLSDYRFSFVVIKEVGIINPDAVVGTENLKDSSVTMGKLGEDVIERLDGVDKIHNSLSYIDVKSFGVKTDGTDELDKIQEILNNHSNVMFKDGVFTIRAGEGLALNNNQSILIHPNATIRVLDNDLERYYIFNIDNKSNIKIYGGGTLQGDLPTHLGATGEWGYCLRIRESSNIYINDLTIKDAWGDGISTVLNSNITIKNLIVDNCGRNGVSIASCNDFYGENWKITNIKRTFPKAGIDIEGESNNPHFKNLHLKDIKTENCGVTGIDVYITDYLTNMDDVQIKIENHKDVGSPYGIRIFRSVNFGTPVTYRKKVNGFIEIINPVYEKTSRGSIRILNWCEDSPILKITNPKIINCNNNGGYISNNYNSKSESSGIVSLFEANCVSNKNMGDIIIENPYIDDCRDEKLMTNGIFVWDMRTPALSTKNFKLINPIKISCKYEQVQIIGDKNIVDNYNFFVDDMEYYSYIINKESKPHMKITNNNTLGVRTVSIYDEMGNGDQFTLSFTDPSKTKVAINLNYLTDKKLYPLISDSTSYLQSQTIGSSITIKKDNGKLYVVNMIGEWTWA